jgi:HEPN domain-containing protein
MKDELKQLFSEAEKEFSLAREELALETSNLVNVCLHSERSIQKYLKMLAIYKGINPANDGKFFKRLEDEYPAISAFKDEIEKIQEYATQTLSGKLEPGIAEDSFQICRQVRAFVMQSVGS